MFLFIDFVRVTNCFYDYDNDNWTVRYVWYKTKLVSCQQLKNSEKKTKTEKKRWAVSNGVWEGEQGASALWIRAFRPKHFRVILKILAAAVGCIHVSIRYTIKSISQSVSHS